MHLLDRLEGLVSSSRALPFSSKALVDEREFLDLVDQLRLAIPEELRQAKRLTQERERILAEARAEADKTIHNAQQQAAFMVQESELTQAAKSQAAEVLDQARREAEEMRLGADEYAREALLTLENELNKLLLTVKKGRAMLDKGSREASRPEATTR